MRIHAHTDHTHRVIELAITGAFELDNFVADDFVESRVVVAIILCDRFPHAVVSQPTDIAAAHRHDFVEQQKF